MTCPTIYLHALDSDMTIEWRDAFTDVPGVLVVEGDILEGRCDAVVGPANSFGFMDGGIDLAYRRYFGIDLQVRVQAKIRSELFELGQVLWHWICKIVTSSEPFNRATPKRTLATDWKDRSRSPEYSWDCDQAARYLRYASELLVQVKR